MHFREIKKTSSTGALALLALVNSTLYVHGRQNAPLNLDPLLDEGRRLLLLFPAEDAQVLTPSLIAQDPRPIDLIVPDGNWNQANRIPKRVAALRQVQRVVLAPGAPSRWGVRQETRPQGLATFEAIARAFGIIESVAVQAQLEALLDLVTERTFVARGDGAQRHYRAASGAGAAAQGHKSDAESALKRPQAPSAGADTRR